MYFFVLIIYLFRKHSIRPAKYSLFENYDEQLSEKDIVAYLDEGHLNLAKDAKNNGRFEEALSLLNRMQTAEASFETALVKYCLLSSLAAIYAFISCN